MSKKMIKRLKLLIDECEDKPKLKAILLKVAELPESVQEHDLKLIQIAIKKIGLGDIELLQQSKTCDDR